MFERKDFDWSKSIRARERRRTPVVLSIDETRCVLDQLEGTTQIMGRLMYGSGLRLRELIRLLELAVACILDAWSHQLANLSGRGSRGMGNPRGRIYRRA